MTDKTQQPDELAKLRVANYYVLKALKFRFDRTKDESEAAWLDNLIDQLEGATESTSILNPTMRESVSRDEIMRHFADLEIATPHDALDLLLDSYSITHKGR